MNQGGRAKFQDGALAAYKKGMQTTDPDYDIDAMRDPFAFESSIGGGFNYKPNESWEASQARQKQEAMNKRQQINTEFQNYLDQQGYQKYLSDRDVYQSAPNIMGRENKLKAELNRLAAQDKDVAEDFGFANILNDPNYGKEITGYTGPEQMTPVYRNLSPEALQEKLGGSLENIYNQYGIWNNQFRQDPLTSGQLEDLTKYGDVDPKYSERIDYMMPESFSNLEDIKRRLDPNYGRFDKYNPANKLNYEDIEFKQGYGLSGPSEFYKDILDKTQGLPSKYHGYAKTLMDKLRNPYEPTTQASTPVAEDKSLVESGIQAAGKYLDPGKVASTAGKGMTTIYSGTTQANPFGGSKFYATPDKATAMQYMKEGAAKGSPFGKTSAAGKLLQADVPTSQVQDLLKKGASPFTASGATREVVLDPKTAKTVFETGKGTLKGAGNIGTKLALGATKAIPVAGTAITLADAAARAKRGDYVGAGLGTVGALPIVGIPALAAQAAYDHRDKIAPYIKKFGSTLGDKMASLRNRRGVDPRMAASYAQNRQIMADPRMNAPMGAAKGGLANILGV